MTLVAALLQPIEAVDAVGTGRPDTSTSVKPVAVHDATAKPRKSDHQPRVPTATPKTALPKAGSAEVTLKQPVTPAAPGTRSALGATASAQAPGMPVRLTAAAAPNKSKGLNRSATPTAVTKARVSVVDVGRSKAAGVPNGVLLTVSRTDGATTSGKLGVQLDYRAFADTFGGGYGSRLRFTRLPACALTTPDKPSCRRSQPIASSNDTEDRQLNAAAVPVAGATGTKSADHAPVTVLAATAKESSDKSDYKATKLASASSWRTDLNSGAFTWSYDMPAPDVPGDFVPQIGLAYNSSAVDGRTSATNNQANWAGDGFEMWPGFIEREYKACRDDGAPKKDGQQIGDLCWGYDNATLSLNGHSGELVPAGKDSWHIKGDDGTKVDHLTSSKRGNGDNDGEYWRVTTPDGTRYYFGYNRLPGWKTGKPTTDSTWAVPVYGNNAGEPCHKGSFADSWCQQAWRWNLDYAVDTHGNAISYYYNKETNSYGRNLTPKDDTSYVRGGTLDHIDYGLKSSDLYAGKALGRMTFGTKERCLPQSGVTCAADTIDKKSFYWYDTPWDLNCKAGTTCDEGRMSPSFWTRRRLTSVTTQILKDKAYADVDSWSLNHRWGMADTDYQLLLTDVQHTGHSGSKPITLPKTTFSYVQRDNRLDKTGDDSAPFTKERLATVDDETGGQVDVDYSKPACTFSSTPKPQSNTSRCFPQFWDAGGGSTDVPLKQDWFNKYVVTQVIASDRTGASPDQVTKYDYLGDAAWHYDDDEGLVKEKYKTWSQWRGYGHVRVETGSTSRMESRSESYFLRGMDGDRAGKDGGKKTVTVDDGDGAKITDYEALAGFTYRTEDYSSPSGKVLKRTVNHPWHHQTAKRTHSWGTTTANLTGTADTETHTSLDDGAGKKWRTTKTANTFENTAGRITQVDDRGDTSTAADDRCTRTSYAENTGSWILTLKKREETVAQPCSATPDRAAHALSDVRTSYDGKSYGTAPTKGDATATETLKKYDGAKPVYLKAEAGFDSYGRKLSDTDLSARTTYNTDGSVASRTDYADRTATTSYSPATGIPTKTVTKTPPRTAGKASTAMTTTVDLDPLRGQPKVETDTNGKQTVHTYDALGRAVSTWLPDRKVGADPNYRFTYQIADGKPTAVSTSTLSLKGNFHTTWTIYDGFLKERQTQGEGPKGTRVVADTFYNGRGLKDRTFNSYNAPGAPSATLLVPDKAVDVDDQNVYTYDGLGRETSNKWIYGDGETGKTLGITTTSYRGDRTTVTPPAGTTPTTTITDARGQTTELRQYHGTKPTGDYDATKYTYTPAGKLSSVTDPAGTKWSYSYDLAGHQTSASDPDKGTTTSTYDDRGLLTTTKDARGQVLHYSYDNADRKTEERKDSATGQLLASWQYDDVPGAVGQPSGSIRYVGGEKGDAYETYIGEYDARYRATDTTTVLPDSEGPMAGEYTYGVSYNRDDTIQSTSDPSVPGSPGETTVRDYDNLKRLTKLTTTYKAASVPLITDAVYDPLGKPLQYELATGKKKAWITNTYSDGYQRLATTRTDRQDVAGVDRAVSYRYDQSGNVTSASDASRDGNDTQCFRYDYLQRMTEAWAQDTTTCADKPAADKLGGPAPYWNSYTYDLAGNRTGETRHDPTGKTADDVKRTYTYPKPTADQPHTLTKVDTTGPTGTQLDTYSYDKTGNTTARNLHGTDQALTWDAEDHLATLTTGKDKTGYLYDADGNRLLKRTAKGTTYYLGDSVEAFLAKGAKTPQTTRYYAVGSGATAVRTPDGKLSIQITDHHNTGELSISADDQKLSQRRNLPFGGTRVAKGAWAGSRGFVGGTIDDESGLVHLGAREYDPSTGRFASVDPEMDLTDPQQMQGYTYSNNNPETMSDPDGKLFLEPPAGNKGSGRPGSAYSDEKRDSVVTTPVRNFFTNPYTGITLKLPAKHRKNFLKKFEIVFRHEWKRSNPQTQASVWAVKTRSLMQTCAFKGMDCSDVELSYTLADTEAEAKDGGGITEQLPGTPARVGRAGRGRTSASADSVLPPELGGCNSFDPRTSVLLADGNRKRIEDIKTGDRIRATDPETGKTRNESVVRTIKGHGTKHLVKITLKLKHGRSASVTATDGHPFWVPQLKRWITASDLKPGQALRTSAGTWVQISAIKRWTRTATVYNLTIGHTHTYYVLAGETSVLVHNSGGCIPALRGWSSQRFQFGNQTFLLDKNGMEHILTRHHPKMWDGSVKAQQSFFDPKMSVADVQDALGQVMRQNRNTLVQRGSRGMYQIQGNVNGVDYVLGMNKGRVGQFYPVTP